jgi:hypothetical protein
MPINLAGGYAAGGVRDALLDIVKQRMLEQELAQREEENQFQRLRANRLDERAGREEARQKEQDLYTRTRQGELDALAKETRQQQNEIGQYNLLTGKPAADIKASLGEDLSTGQTVRTAPNPAIPGNAPSYLIGQNTKSMPMVVNGMRIRPQSAEDIDLGQAADEKRKTDEAIRLANAKPPNRTALSGFVGPNGEPLQQDEQGHIYAGPDEIPLSQVRRAPPQRDPGAASARDDARLDRSYQYNVTELREMRKPIQDRAERLGRLGATINEMTPQADALVAPELMTVMAGGMGSGLRINEAEILRVLGGRTNLEAVKAALNKWQVDPSKGLSITPAQRGQIGSLMGTIAGRVREQLKVISDGLSQINQADSVDEHRRILQETQQKYDAISLGDTATGGGNDAKSVTAAELAQLAKAHGTTVEQERARATAEGFVIR